MPLKARTDVSNWVLFSLVLFSLWMRHADLACQENFEKDFLICNRCNEINLLYLRGKKKAIHISIDVLCYKIMCPFCSQRIQKILCYETAELCMWFCNTSDDISRCFGQVIYACYARLD